MTSTTQHQHEVLGVDYMLQALEELNMDSLPQQLRDSQRLQKQKKQDEKSKELAGAVFAMEFIVCGRQSWLCKRKYIVMLHDFF